MMIKLLLLFTLVPLLEIWLLIEVGGVIGALPTILLVALTGFVGVFLARSQGLYILQKMGEDLAEGIIPGDRMFDGACILVGGALLLTPGLLTDLFGFLLLFPFSRLLFKKAAQNYIRRGIENGTLQIWWRR